MVSGDFDEGRAHVAARAERRRGRAERSLVHNASEDARARAEVAALVVPNLQFTQGTLRDIGFVPVPADPRRA